MRRLRSLTSGILLVAAVLIVPATPAAAAATVSVAHAGSFDFAQVPSGALAAVYVGIDLGYTSQSFAPWAQVAPNGLRIEATCSAERPWINLPMLWVGGSSGLWQANVYIPNSDGPEPWGRCDNAADGVIRVYPFGDPARMIESGLRTVALHPGLLGANGRPTGTHLNGATGAPSPLYDCNAGSVPCPVSTGGTPAQLLLNVTGSDAFICNPCVGGRVGLFLTEYAGEEVSATAMLWVSAASRTATNGVEQLRVQLPAGLRGNTTYTLQVWNFQTGFAAQTLYMILGRPT